jgi:hypothetical protein
MSFLSRSRRASGGLALLLALAASNSLSLRAQTSRGSITGIVTDQTGAAIPNAAVTLIGTITRSAATNDSGLYRFDAVEPGDYAIEFSASGFKKAQRTAITAAGGQVTSIDAQLEVGDTTTVLEVTDSAGAILQYEAPVRGGSFSGVQNTQLPLPLRNPTSLAILLPGVSSNRYGFGNSTGAAGQTYSNFVVNGGRGRSNNFMIDGTENNDISVGGQGLRITNPEAVQEVSVQTGNFDAEFGRAGGAVINVITRGGANELHGSLNYLLDSTVDDALTNTQALSPEAQRRGRVLPGTDQYYGGTFGGPISRNRTFYFASYQEQRQNSQNVNNLITLTGQGRSTLRGLFPQGANANADTYLDYTKDATATSQPFSVALGNGRPSVEFGTAIVPYGNKVRDRQILGRLDHKINDSNFLMGRYVIQDKAQPVGGATNFFPGFATGAPERVQSVALTYTRVFTPTLTNEARLSYNRLLFDFPSDTANSIGRTLPRYTIAGITAIGLQTNIPQGRVANNYSLQNTTTVIRGRHTFRFGADLLQQRSRQAAPQRDRGEITFNASTGFTGFANFIDDFGGSAGGTQRDFGSAIYYPELFRQSYFFTDRWRVTNDLTLSLGIRYEDFGTPMNSLFKPAFSGLFNIDTTTWDGPYSKPNKVARDLNNFSPSLGIAWSPSCRGGLLATLFGDKKSVFRTGYQIGYDSFFNNIASNAVASVPNLIATSKPSVVSASDPRGLAGVSKALPTQSRAPLPIDGQTLMDENLRNPYYQRWSFGIQRELPSGFIAEASYVGSKGTKLFINEDRNPLVPVSLRIQPTGFTPPYATQGRYDNLQGARLTRTNAGSSSFNSMQLQVTRRFRNGFTAGASYTWSKTIDNGSEIFGVAATGLSQQSAVPWVFGGGAYERALSFFDRPHRFTTSYVYQLPFYKDQKGFAGRLLGGWQLSGILLFEAGVPFNLTNGQDADGLGGALDRPIYNPSGVKGSRAVPSSTSSTGFADPDNANAPVDPSKAMYIGIRAHSGNVPLPTGNLGRNTWRGPGIANWDATVQKTVNLTERVRLELRGEFFNALNHPQYGVPSVSPFAPQGNTDLQIQTSVANAPAGRFLRPEYADGGSRIIRYQLVLRF